ncbi:MAG: DUF3842 family protein [bacterium]
MKNNMPIVGVIDGQGGGVGAFIVKQLREKISYDLEIVALGTNAVAAQMMMKSKANRGASGENAIITTVPKLDLIIGPLAIVIPDSMMGEVSPAIAAAVSSCRAEKYLLPLHMEKLEVVGYKSHPFPHLIDIMIGRLKNLLVKPAL